MSKAEEAKALTSIAASKRPQIVAALAGKGFVSKKLLSQICGENIFCMYFITVEIPGMIIALCLTLVVAKNPPHFLLFSFCFQPLWVHLAVVLA